MHGEGSARVRGHQLRTSSETRGNRTISERRQTTRSAAAGHGVSVEVSCGPSAALTDTCLSGNVCPRPCVMVPVLLLWNPDLEPSPGGVGGVACTALQLVCLSVSHTELYDAPARFWSILKVSSRRTTVSFRSTEVQGSTNKHTPMSERGV